MDFIIRIILCIIFPPLAVIDKGIKIILLVLLLTCFGWIPGSIVALYLCYSDKNKIGKSK